MDSRFIEFVRAYFKIHDIEANREELIEKVVDGVILTPHELNFLTLTSPTLSNFIDKDLFQNVVDILDPRFIDNVLEF